MKRILPADLVTSAEAQQILGVKKSRFDQLLDAHGIPRQFVGGDVFRRADIERLKNLPKGKPGRKPNA